MINETNAKKQLYIAPKMLCVELATKVKILTVSGEIKDVPWEDE